MDLDQYRVEWNAGGGSGFLVGKENTNVLVMFYNRSVEIPAKSAQLGRRYCENQIYVKIQHPGETNNIIDRPVRDEDKVRYASHWRAFVMNRTQVPEGTPIDLLFPNNPAFAENLRAMGIYTIEQCSELSAIAIENIGRGGQEAVNRAKQYLANAQKGVGFHEWKKKEEEWAAHTRRLENQIAELTSKLNAVLMKDREPEKHSLSPPFIPGYDAQTERINANHITHDLAKQAAASQQHAAQVVSKFVPDAIPGEPTFPEEFSDMLK